MDVVQIMTWNIKILTWIIVIGIISIDAYDSSQKCSGNTEVQWTGGNGIEWPCSTTKSFYKSSGKYISKNMMASRAVVHKDDAFLALPRYRPGVPFTLAKVGLRGKYCQASLSPFPCWSLQEEGNCFALQSIVDIFLDPQGIIWALDSGVVDSLAEANRTCPAKVIAINVKTGKVVRRVDISALTTENTRLQYVVADYSRDGRAFVYVSDASNRAILVFDASSGHGYRVVLPETATYGISEGANDRLLYIALIRRANSGNFLVFSYFGSNRLFSIASNCLQTGSIQGNLTDIGPTKKKLVFLGTDNGSAIFFRKQGQSDIYKWDLQENPSVKDIQKVYQGSMYALPCQVMPDYKKGRMRVLETNFPDYFRGTVGCGINHYIKLI